jgi:cytochrome P450
MTVPNPADVTGLNLADPRTHAENELGELWRYLRSEHPVFWHAPAGSAPGFWVLTRYDDIVSVYRDAGRFSSERGNVLASLLTGGDSAGGRMMAVTDGPRHSAMRKLLSGAFVPRFLDIVAEQVHAATRRLLVEAAHRGQCDFARDVAAHIPLATICELLGVPPEDRQFLLRLTSAALSSAEPTQSAAEVWLARNEILLYFTGLARARRDTPHADVVSLLATHRVDGEYLTMDEVILNCYSLILGGDETTRLSMVGAAAALIDHPRQWDALRRGAVDTAKAVEEVLRWATPAMHAGRTATEDVVIRGQRIRAGEIVTLWNTSANRDERVFRDAAVLDFGRSPNRHLAFGYGAHFCLGAALARIEIGALLDGLRSVVSVLAPSGDRRRIFSNFLSGYGSLPVILTS